MRVVQVTTVVHNPRLGRPFEYRLQVLEAPAWKVLRGQAYHWWDMHFLPLHRALAAVADRVRPPHFDHGRFRLPYLARQDCRCYEWNNHRQLAEFPIDHDTYLRCGGTRA